MAYIPKPVRQLKMQFIEDMQRVNNAPLLCPKCGSSNLIRYGTTPKGTPRHQCLDCKKVAVIHSHHANTSSYRNIEVWDIFVDCMLSCRSVRQTASICGIGNATAMRWRHQLFDSLEKIYIKKKAEPASDSDSDNLDDLDDTLDFGLDEPDDPMWDFTQEDEEEIFSIKTENEFRVDVERWRGVYLKNVPKYKLWHKFVRDAQRSGYEKKYIEDRVLKK